MLGAGGGAAVRRVGEKEKAIPRAGATRSGTASGCPKGNRVTKPDGSWREEVRQGNCLTIKEKDLRPASIRKRQCNPKAAAINLTRAFEAALRALIAHSGRPVPGQIAAITHLSASVGTGEDRPVARGALVDAMRRPHVEVLILADETGVGHPLAGVAGVVDRALERDREVEGIELVKLVLLLASDLDRRGVGLLALRSPQAAAARSRRRGDDQSSRIVPPSWRPHNESDARRCAMARATASSVVRPAPARRPCAGYRGSSAWRRSEGRHRPSRRPERERIGDAFEGESLALLGCERITAEAEGRPARSRDRKAEDRAQVQLELVRELADQGDHAGVVRAGAQLGEDRLVAADEEFDAENAVAAQRVDDLARLEPGRLAAPPAGSPPAASFRDNRRLPGGGRWARRTARRPWSRR